MKTRALISLNNIFKSTKLTTVQHPFIGFQWDVSSHLVPKCFWKLFFSSHIHIPHILLNISAALFKTKEKRGPFYTYTKTGNQTRQVNMPWCEHVKLLKTGYGSCLNKRVGVILCDGTPHQAGRADCWNGDTITYQQNRARCQSNSKTSKEQNLCTINIQFLFSEFSAQVTNHIISKIFL